MKALVIGYGSIGRRHARLLGDLGVDVAVVSRRNVDAAKTYAAIPEAVVQSDPVMVQVAKHAESVVSISEDPGAAKIDAQIWSGSQVELSPKVQESASMRGVPESGGVVSSSGGSVSVGGSSSSSGGSCVGVSSGVSGVSSPFSGGVVSSGSLGGDSSSFEGSGVVLTVTPEGASSS